MAMALEISLGVFVFLLAAISIYGYRAYARPARILDQVGAAAREPDRIAEGAQEQRANGFQVTTVVQWVGEKLPKSPEQYSVTRKLLGMAGYRADAALAIYTGTRLVAVLVGMLAAFTALQQTRFSYGICVGGTAVAGFAVFSGCSIVLDELVKRRKERLRFALPDALDLLVVCVEAGLGLDQAIAKVTTELAVTHPEISSEFGLVSLDMRAGSDRATALRNLASRTGEEEMRKLTALLVQTDRFGTSLAESLRTHANFMRVRRRHQAEERAGKLGVKLTFPIFFFILPSIMVIAAGPAILKLFKELLPALRGTPIAH
jgi:tight adherence protein C